MKHVSPKERIGYKEDTRASDYKGRKEVGNKGDWRWLLSVVLVANWADISAPQVLTNEQKDQ